MSAFSGCFFVFILWESLVNRNMVLGYYGISGILTNLMYSPIAEHNNYFTYTYNVDNTYGPYYMH